MVTEHTIEFGEHLYHELHQLMLTARLHSFWELADDIERYLTEKQYI